MEERQVEIEPDQGHVDLALKSMNLHLPSRFVTRESQCPATFRTIQSVSRSPHARCVSEPTQNRAGRSTPVSNWANGSTHVRRLATPQGNRKILAASTSRCDQQQTAEIPVRICSSKLTGISHEVWLREGRRRQSQFITEIIPSKGTACCNLP